MSQSVLAALSAILVWVALIAYAVSGGADFGGGIWDLLARGPTAQRDREAIAHGMGPVWESNNIWLIFVLVVTWTAFPIVFAGVSTALFIPITLVVIGIVLRGAAFSFRSNYGLEIGAGLAWGHIFNIASTLTPALFGTMAAALVSGDIRISESPVRVQANPWTTWTTPFALACGVFAVGLCSVLAATYLTVDARNAGDTELTERFRGRALVAGAVTAAIGAVAAVLAISEAPTLWRGLIGRALPLSLAAIVVGLAAAAALLRHVDLLARVLVAGECVCILLAWGVAQWPYLIVPDVTVDSAASPASVLGPMLVVSIIGLLVVAPALWYLFSIFKRRGTTGAPASGVGARVTTASFVATLQTGDGPAVPPSETAAFSASTPATIAPAATTGQRLMPVLAVVLAIAAAPLITNAYDTLRQIRQIRRRHVHHRAPAQ